MQPQKICQRYDALKGLRATWEHHWQEVAEYIFPRRAEFNVTRTEGEKRNEKILDGTGGHALELLAAGLHGMVSNPASRWFTLRTGDTKLNENDEVRTWLADAEDRMFAKMHSPGSSITSNLHELYIDYASFGTGVMFIGQGQKDGLLFQTRFLGECVIDENAEGMVDTVIREFKLTVRQCWQRWGNDCSAGIQKMYRDGNLDHKVDILHAVFPREDADHQKITPDAMPWASIYVEKKENHVLQNGGFEEFPYAVPRWYKVAGEKYGRSPAMAALPDVKMLQAMMKTLIRSSQKICDPALLVPDEGRIGPVRTTPGGLNFYRGERTITPLLTGGNLPITMEIMQNLRDRIMSVFFVDQLQMQGGAQMTATEVMRRTEERMRLLGPILGRMEGELLSPIITRVFGIMLRNGEFLEQPEALDGVEWRAEYVSPIALAQKGQKVERAVQALTMAGQMASFDPSVLERFNSSAFLPWVADALGVDPKLILDDEEIAAKQQASQMMNAIGPAAEAAKAFAAAGSGAKSFAEARQIS